MTRAVPAARRRPGNLSSRATQAAAQSAVEAPAVGGRLLVGSCWYVGFAVAAGGAVDLAGHPQLVPVAGVGLGVVGVLLLVSALRSRARARLVAVASAAVAPLLGVRSLSVGSQLLRVRWARGLGVGVPRRVAVCPPASCDLADPPLLEELGDTLSRRFNTRLRVQTVRRRRHQAVYVSTPAPAADPADSDPTVRRAKLVLAQHFGVETPLKATFDADGDLDSFVASYPAHPRTSSPTFRVMFDRNLNEMLPGRWRVRWASERDEVTVARPHLSTKVDHPPADPTLDPDHLPYAVDEDGQPVTWPLRLSPHALVAGTTGSGKTVVLMGLVTEVALRGWPCRICDPKRVEFLGMRGHPNVQIVATTAIDMVTVIDDAHATMEARYAALEAGDCDEDDFEPLFVVLDEYREFQDQVSAWWAVQRAITKGLPTRPTVFAKVGSLARLGRTARVHLVIGIQRPDVDKDFLSGEMRDNFRCRISLGPLSVNGAQMMWESPHIGRTVPGRLRGRATAVTSSGFPGEVQCYWTPDPRRTIDGSDDDTLLRRLHPDQVNHPFLRVTVDSEDALAGRIVDADGPPARPWQSKKTAATQPAQVAVSGDDETWGAQAVEVAGDVYDDLYQPPSPAAFCDLDYADMVEVDPSTGEWGIVESIDPDPDDHTQLIIDYRTADGGEPGCLRRRGNETLQRRQQRQGDHP